MPNKVYVVTRITDKLGFIKHNDLPHSRVFDEKVAIVSSLEIGKSVVLDIIDIEGTLYTSTVEDFSMQGENVTTIITRNTVYHLEVVESK